MSKLETVEAVVEKILENEVETRENDEILYVRVCESYCKGISSMSMKDFFFGRSKTICPAFTCVCRVRRKLFNKRPELKPKESVTKARAELEVEYKDYSKRK